MSHARFDREQIKFKSVKERRSKLRIEGLAIEAYRYMEPLSMKMTLAVADLALHIKRAKNDGRPIILCMGAHPIKNGAGLILNELIDKGFITHVATNGACAIHDWEFAMFGKSTECVRTNVAIGEFGLWKETGEFFGNSAAQASIQDCGWGEMIGLWMQDRVGGTYKWGDYSVMLKCHRKGIPFTIHPGIGQDIVYAHPNMDNVSCTIIDFEIFTESIRHLQGGVYLSVGSAVMSPMIFEKALSMARNVQLQRGLAIDNFTLAVNDLADQNWNWDDGEPQMDNPAYYLRFMKTFHRMGGDLRYFGIHNVAFLRNLLAALA
jgi:hypothetical protein